jgi:hypothetical protein
MQSGFKEDQFEIRISENANWALFEKFAQTIASEFEAKITERIDGLDERYWDFRIGEIALTLHLQHYLGISLFPAISHKNNASAKALADNIAKRLIQVGIKN